MSAAVSQDFAAPLAPPDLAGQFRDAMRRRAASVSVIATAHNGRPFGLTATAVCSVSMDPPSVLVCVNRSADAHAALTETGQSFSVNILATDQRDVSQLFGGGAVRGEDRFRPEDWLMHEDGPPSLRAAAASLICRVDAVMQYGTHSVVVGRVDRVELGENQLPLMYFNGNYTEPRC